MKLSKNKLITIVCIFTILLAAFLYSGFYNSKVTTNQSKTQASNIDKSESVTDNIEEDDAIVSNQIIDDSLKNAEEIRVKDLYDNDSVLKGKPLPIDPENIIISDKELNCMLKVRCDTILDNIEYLNPEKIEVVPDDGIIFPLTEVVFYEGESAFNVLQREMKKNKIHLEFVNTPIFNSVYIEGINNLYELDCKELSGWLYKVNGWFPSYGSSRYQLQENDVIEFVYTCDLGRDLDGYADIGGGN